MPPLRFTTTNLGVNYACDSVRELTPDEVAAALKEGESLLADASDFATAKATEATSARANLNLFRQHLASLRTRQKANARASFRQANLPKMHAGAYTFKQLVEDDLVPAHLRLGVIPFYSASGDRLVVKDLPTTSSHVSDLSSKTTLASIRKRAGSSAAALDTLIIYGLRTSYLEHVSDSKPFFGELKNVLIPRLELAEVALANPTS